MAGEEESSLGLGISKLGGLVDVQFPDWHCSLPPSELPSFPQPPQIQLQR